MLALPAPQSEEDKASLVACCFCLRQRRLEPAGHSFHAVHEKPLLEGKRRGKAGKEKVRDASDDEMPEDSKWRKKRKEGGEKKQCGALKLSPNLQGVDLYALLEVSEGATAEQIKKQYRKLALQHHPDKHGGADADKDTPVAERAGGLSDQDMLFVKIQEAYEVLSDSNRRRQYDSTLDFDESIPEEVNAKLGFYGTFLPVFNRNARWSTRQPVPDLGDDSLAIEKVHKFYDWWFSFESWRDFSMHDEYNLDDAEFREERRWMDRQNQKLRKKYIEAEHKRIHRLVEVAERLDPRIRAEREEREAKKREEKERRARLKQEEEEARRKEEEEKRLREEREQAEREEKERQERELRKQSKQVLKSLRQRLKKCVQGKCTLNNSDAQDLQDFSLDFDEPEPLEALCVRFEALSSGSAVEKAVKAEVAEWRRRQMSEQEEQARIKEEAKKREEQRAKDIAEAAAAGTPWSAEELGLLAKGLQKFPGGMGGRWALITQLLNTSGYERTEREVVEKTKELSDGQSLKSMGSRLADETGLGKFQAPKAKSAPAPKAGAIPKAAATKVSTSKAEENPQPNGSKDAKGGGEQPTVEWTSEQQKALEAALQKYPASLDKNERWKLIAEEVPGKTKAQCVERFKYLREQVKKKG